MTMLNGEPVDTGVPSTAPPPGEQVPDPRQPAFSSDGRPIRVGAGTDPTNRSMARIVAIVGLIMAFTVPPLGIIMGGVARAMLKPEKSSLTTWAIVLGIVFTVLWILATIAFVVFIWWTTTSAICIDGEVVNEVFGFPICT